MARDLLLDLERLVGMLVTEAMSKPTSLNPDEVGSEETGPDYTDRLKAVDAATRFLIVKNKLVPPEKGKSMFEGMRDELLSGTPSGRTGASPKGKNGRAVSADPSDTH